MSHYEKLDDASKAIMDQHITDLASKIRVALKDKTIGQRSVFEDAFMFRIFYKPKLTRNHINEKFDILRKPTPTQTLGQQETHAILSALDQLEGLRIENENLKRELCSIKGAAQHLFRCVNL